MSKLRVLIAEDHETVREGIKMLINAQPDMEVVSEASDGLTAISRAQAVLPDVVLMDVSMPGATGFQATEKLNQTCPQVKVVALTRHRDKAYLQQLVRAGADGYVLKQSPAEELLRAIRAVASGGQYLDTALTGKVLAGYAGEHPSAKGGSQPWISRREEEVLKLIAWGNSNKEIAAKLDISVKTVEAHRANAMRKLDLHSRIDIVRFALLQGWLNEE
ncbi:MAG TPA: response regulator transcription factor [Blastocatellia bacterium]|nr:response regulator transcription factor [Blastocatellia bacterium]